MVTVTYIKPKKNNTVFHDISSVDFIKCVLLIRNKKRRKREIWVNKIYKDRETFGINQLVREMQL